MEVMNDGRVKVSGVYAYTEIVHTRERLVSAIDALDRLGKGYTIARVVSENNDDWKRAPEAYWCITEVVKSCQSNQSDHAFTQDAES